MGYLCHFPLAHLFSLVFSKIWEELFFVGSGKYPCPTKINSHFLSTKQTKIIFSSWFSILPKITQSKCTLSFKWYYIVHGLEPTWKWIYKRRFWIFLCIYTITIILSIAELSNGELQSIHTMGFCPQNHDPCLVLPGSVTTCVIQYLKYSSKLHS